MIFHSALSWTEVVFPPRSCAVSWKQSSWISRLERPPASICVPAAPALVTWHHLHANRPVRASSGRPGTHCRALRCPVTSVVGREPGGTQECSRHGGCVRVSLSLSLSLARWRQFLLFPYFVCLWLTCVTSRISTSLPFTLFSCHTSCLAACLSLNILIIISQGWNSFMW